MVVLRSRTPREVLNEIRFRKTGSSGGLGLDEVELSVLHRAGPENRPVLRRVAGRDILRLERTFFYTSGPRGETAIPYHRVRVISWEGREVWRRPEGRRRDLAPVAPV